MALGKHDAPLDKADVREKKGSKCTSIPRNSTSTTKTMAKLPHVNPALSEEEDEVSSSSKPSPSSAESSDDSGPSDSDSLDSQSSRKRRKTSQTRDDAPITSRFSAPSRIKSVSSVKQDVVPAETVFAKAAGSVGVSVPLQQTSFEALDVKPWLVGALGAMAIKRPTGIQKLCIPQILKGRDCIGGSRTGSGKTVAFAVPILQKWAEDPFGIFALVLTPTRY